MKYCLRNKLIFTFLLFGFIAKSQSVNLDELDGILSKYAKEHSIVGLSIGVTYKNESYTKSYGHLNHDQKILVTDSTMFNIASISKLFTSTAILQLVGEHQLKLNDKLVDILPEFKMKDKRFSTITIEQLLTHSSGLMWNNKLKHSPDNKEALALYLKNLETEKLNFNPGQKMSYETYSNVAYDLLGIVIEKITNKAFHQYIKTNILEKLGMHQSSYFYEQIDSVLLALPQIIAGDSKAVQKLNFEGIDDKKHPILNGDPLHLKTYQHIGETYEHNPSGNLISSAKELNLFAKEMLAIANQNNIESIINHTQLMQLWKPSHTIKERNISIGLGWWIKHDSIYDDAFFHVGTNPGYCSIMILYPSKNLGITILCNGWYAKEAVWKKILNDITTMFIE